MKDGQITMRLSGEEKTLLRKAAKNLSFETGAKEDISKAIRHSVKKYAETDLTKPELFLCDRDAIKQIDSNINYGLIYLQKFLDEFKEITGQSLTRDELENIFSSIGKLGSESRIQSAIQEQVNSKLYNRLVKAHPDMVVSFDNVPQKDLTSLYEIANNLDSVPMVKMRFAGIFWNCYSVTGNVVSVIPDQAEHTKSGYRFYASTPEELQKLAMVKKLCQVINELLEDKEIIPEKIFTFVFYDNEAGIYSPSGAYVKFNHQPKILFERYSK